MPKKKIPTTIEECNAEMERTQPQIRQYENRSKMLDRKIAAHTRKERNHRIYFYGGFLDGIMPELKDMTEAEFYSLTERIFSLPEVKRIVRLAAPDSGQKDGD